MPQSWGTPESRQSFARRRRSAPVEEGVNVADVLTCRDALVELIDGWRQSDWVIG
jgi:hypothetical protein